MSPLFLFVDQRAGERPHVGWHRRRTWNDRVTRSEIAGRVEEEGLSALAHRLSMTPEELIAATYGAARLSPLRVLAMRDGVDLGPLLEAFRRAVRKREPIDA